MYHHLDETQRGKFDKYVQSAVRATRMSSSDTEAVAFSKMIVLAGGPDRWA